MFLTGEDSANVYAVDSTFPATWKESVYYPSLKTLRTSIEWGNFVDGIHLNSPIFEISEVSTAIKLEPIPKTPQNFDDTPRIRRSCANCGGKIFLSDSEWEGKYPSFEALTKNIFGCFHLQLLNIVHCKKATMYSNMFLNLSLWV